MLRTHIPWYPLRGIVSFVGRGRDPMPTFIHDIMASLAVDFDVETLWTEKDQAAFPLDKGQTSGVLPRRNSRKFDFEGMLVH